MTELTKKNAGVLISAPSRGLVRLVRGYQKNISGLKPVPTCRFTPTCSEYAIQAIERFGAIKGSWLAAWRIARCNPFVEGGFDPVPEQFPQRNHTEKKTNS